MAKKKTDEVMAVSPELQKSLEVLNQFTEAANELAANCVAIKVVDQPTLSVAQNNLSKANDIYKAIEETRTTIKKPFLDAGKLIDETAKTLSESIVSGINHLKSEIKAWELKRIEEEKKAKEELERKKKEELEQIERENARKKGIQDYINVELKNWLNKKYNDASTTDLCEKMIETIKTKWPEDEKFQEFKGVADAMRETYIKLFETKKNQLENAGKMSDEEALLAKEKEMLLKQKEELATKEREIAAKEAEIEAEKKRKEAEEAAKKEAEKLEKEATENSAKTRKIWKFELEDKTKLSQEWVAVDAEAVSKWLKENKDKIKSGDVINGVRFYQDLSVSA